MVKTVFLLLFISAAAPAQVPRYSVDMTPGDAHVLFTRDVFSDSLLPGPFTSGDTTWPEAQVRFKGSSTRYFAKKSYRVRFSTSNLHYGYRQINFNSMYTDKSLMREKLAWDLFGELGTLAPTAEHAFLNVAGEPKGLYAQIPKVDKYLLQVNGRQVAPMYDANDFYTAADLTVQPDSLLKLYWEKEIGSPSDYTDLESMIAAINSPPDPSFADTLREYFDTTSILQWFAGNTLTMMGDSYNKNYLLYRDTSRPTGQWTIIPWDYDLSWGRTGDLAIPYPASLLNDGFAYTFPPLDGPSNVLKDRYMADTGLWNGFRGYLANVISTIFTEAHLWPKIDSLANLIRAAAAADPERWGTMEDFEENVGALKYYVTARRNFLLRTFIDPPSGQYNTATVPFSGEGNPHHFAVYDGRLLGTLWFNGVTGLDSVTVTAHPDSTPPDAADPSAGRHVRRWVEVIPYPGTAQFSAKFQWAYQDVSTADREVGAGVGDERLLRAYLYNGSGWSTLPATMNSYANTVTIDSITEGQTGPGRYFALMLSETYARTWERQQNNFWERWHDVKFTDSLHGFIVGEHGSFLRTSDGGDTWERDSIGSALHFYSAVPGSSPDRIFTAGEAGSFYQSADTGRTWQPIDLGVSKSLRGVSFDGPTGVVAGDSGRAFHTIDGGSAWHEIMTGLDDDFTAVRAFTSEFIATGQGVRIFNQAFIPSPPGVVYFVSKSFQTTHVARSVDRAGMTFWVAGDSGMAAFAGTGDSALTYRNLPVVVNLNDVAVIDSEKIYVAGDGGVIHYTVDAGLTWYRQLTGDTHDLNAIAFNGAGRGFAVGSGGTILRTDVPPTLTDVPDATPALPTAFILYQNYPNPFNPATTIAFDLSADATVSLKVYDVLGRLVASGADEVRPAGRNTIIWNASRFASGVYVYRVSAFDRTGRIISSDVRKMVLVR